MTTLTINELPADNNVDLALTPPPNADDWDDPVERSEDTGTAGKLAWGPGADTHYGAAHAAAAALREQRRKGRGDVQLEAPPRLPWFDPANEFDYDATLRAIQNHEPYDYWHFLEFAKTVTKGRKASVATVDIWREPPGYAGYYLMHSISRELWSAPRTITASNGTPRTFQGKKMIAHNGSYSLTINGVTRSRGIDALYRETFPEFSSKKKRKRKVGEWDDTVRPRVSEFEWAGNGGLAEWLAGDSARIVTRPA